VNKPPTVKKEEAKKRPQWQNIVEPPQKKLGKNPSSLNIE
jgi:hypothetical protein